MEVRDKTLAEEGWGPPAQIWFTVAAGSFQRDQLSL